LINLIRNELCKIFHKKAIYVYTIIVLIMLVGISVFGKIYNEQDNEGIGYDQSYVDAIKDSLDDYDLNDENELDMYIGDRVLIDLYKLTSKYSFESPERYYIDTVIEPLVSTKYHLEYESKDSEKAKEVQVEIDAAVKKLDNYDWEVSIKEELKETKAEMKLATDKDELEILKINLWCLNYRLDNDIPYSYSETSSLIEDYKSSAVDYLSIVKDESLIKNNEELIQKRTTEEKYNVSKYKLEHKLYSDSEYMKEYILSSMAYVDGLIIIAIIIIAGSIISEEFSKGTIKQLLIKPQSRCKILTSKIIASLIAISVFVLLYNGVFILANCFEYSDFTSIFGTSVVYDFNLGKVREINFLGHCLYGFISVLPAYLIIFFITIFMGVLSTSTIATISSVFGVYFFYDIFSLAFKPKVLSFLPFYCWDLSPFMFGGLSQNKYSTFGKSLIIDIVTMVGLVALSYILFKKKEIKNQ